MGMATIFIHDSHHRDARLRAPIDGVSDGHLMDRFIDEKDDCAFAELVRRHSAMVLGVCQRVLHNAHDSEDCFQAAFLVLVRKADTIQPREMVGNWLYGVAYRTALEARKLSARRRDMERKKSTQPPLDTSHELWQELRPVLDQELSRLPDKYRAVLVACDLEGKTRHEAAEQLGLPEGTVASRLARARAMLSKRLTKYSLAMNTNLLIAVFAEDATPPEVPPSLLEATIRAGTSLAAGNGANDFVSSKVASLTDTVVQGMAMAKMKIAAVMVLILFVIGLGLSALLPAVQAQRNVDPDQHEGQKKGFDPKKVKPETLRDCVLQTVDLDKCVLHARRSNFATEEGTALYEVQVTPNTVVVIDGREGTLEELKFGDTFNMQIQRQADGPPRALRIETTGREMMGVVEAMSDRTVTIHAEPRGKIGVEETIFDLDEKLTVFIDGKTLKFSDLKARMKVTIKMSANKSKVVTIQALGPKVAAVVKKVDAVKQTVSLQINDTNMVVEGITLMPDAPVLIAGKKSKLNDLQPGMPVNVQMSAETERSVILEIAVPTPAVVERRQVGAK